MDTASHAKSFSVSINQFSDRFRSKMRHGMQLATLPGHALTQDCTSLPRCSSHTLALRMELNTSLIFSPLSPKILDVFLGPGLRKEREATCEDSILRAGCKTFLSKIAYNDGLALSNDTSMLIALLCLLMRIKM